MCNEITDDKKTTNRVEFFMEFESIRKIQAIQYFFDSGFDYRCISDFEQAENYESVTPPNDRVRVKTLYGVQIRCKDFPSDSLGDFPRVVLILAENEEGLGHIYRIISEIDSEKEKCRLNNTEYLGLPFARLVDYQAGITVGECLYPQVISEANWDGEEKSMSREMNMFNFIAVPALSEDGKTPRYKTEDLSKEIEKQRKIIEIGKKSGAFMIASAPCRYLEPSEKIFYLAGRCLKENITPEQAALKYQDSYDFMSEVQMRNSFSYLNDSQLEESLIIENPNRLASWLKWNIYPLARSYKPYRFKGIKASSIDSDQEDAADFLMREIESGPKSYLLQKKEYAKRVEEEITLLRKGRAVSLLALFKEIQVQGFKLESQSRPFSCLEISYLCGLTLFDPLMCNISIEEIRQEIMFFPLNLLPINIIGVPQVMTILGGECQEAKIMETLKEELDSKGYDLVPKVFRITTERQKKDYKKVLRSLAKIIPGYAEKKKELLYQSDDFLILYAYAKKTSSIYYLVEKGQQIIDEQARMDKVYPKIHICFGKSIDELAEAEKNSKTKIPDMDFKDEKTWTFLQSHPESIIPEDKSTNMKNALKVMNPSNLEDLAHLIGIMFSALPSNSEYEVFFHNISVGNVDKSQIVFRSQKTSEPDMNKEGKRIYYLSLIHSMSFFYSRAAAAYILAFYELNHQQ
jgi:hypothetical protein